MKALFTAIFCTVALSSCATYKEPTSGPSATLTCDQPRYGSLMTLPTAPVTRIASVDGKKLFPLFISAEQSVKIPAGTRTITTEVFAGPLRSNATFKMDFKEGEIYKVKTLSYLEGLKCEVKDSKGKTQVLVAPKETYEIPRPTIMFIPAG